MSWFPSAFLHWIAFLSDIILKVLAALFNVQHLSNLIKINPIDNVGWWGYGLSMFGHRRNPGSQENGIEDRVYFPSSQEFELI
jgi:hypothetical protein